MSQDTPVIFDVEDVPNDTSLWNEAMRNSVLSARVLTTTTRTLREEQVRGPHIPIELPEVDTMRSTALFSGHLQSGRMDEWAKLFSNWDSIERDVRGQRGRAVDVRRSTRIQEVLVRARDSATGEPPRPRWIKVNLTPVRLLDLIDDASMMRSPSLTTPAHGRIPLELGSIHQALVRFGPDAVLDQQTVKALLHDSCLDPLATVHLQGWDRRREVRPTWAKETQDQRQEPSSTS